MSVVDYLDDKIFENEHEVGELRRHMRKLLGELKTAKERVRQLEAGRPNPEPEDNSPKGVFFREAAKRLAPFERGTPEYQAEFRKLQAEMDPLIAAEVEATSKDLQKQATTLRGQVASLTKKHEADRIAARIALPGSASALMPFIVEQIEVDASGEHPVLKYRTADGAETTAAGLEAEILKNPSLARIVSDPQTGAAARDHARRVAETLGHPTEKTAQR